MKIIDSNRFGTGINTTSFSLFKNKDITNAQGTIRAALIDLSDNSVIARSTNSIARNTITNVYTQYSFQFDTGAIAPQSNFFIGIECMSCNDAKIFLGGDKQSDSYTLGSEIVFRSGAWED